MAGNASELPVISQIDLLSRLDALEAENRELRAIVEKLLILNSGPLAELQELQDAEGEEMGAGMAQARSLQRHRALCVFTGLLKEYDDIDEGKNVLCSKIKKAIEREDKPKFEASATAHINQLFEQMIWFDRRQVTFNKAADLLGISKTHAHRLKQYLSADSRFAIVKDPHHKQRHLIRRV